MAGKLTPQQAQQLKRVERLVVETVNRAGGVCRLDVIHRTWGEPATTQAIAAGALTALNLNYTDPNGQQPITIIKVVATPIWDRKTRPAWLP